MASKRRNCSTRTRNRRRLCNLPSFCDLTNFINNANRRLGYKWCPNTIADDGVGLKPVRIDQLRAGGDSFGLDPQSSHPLSNPTLLTMASLKKGGTPVRKGQSQLRSPVIKRSPLAAVTLQGWLHKQGSDGLMLWKKRWFVLSDYCLFYYKGPEEEKLLGSFLLASYKVSPCTAEDKVYRKYSFKAEHANMRTYYFAADNQALMAQWMNALSLASILQESWDEKKNKNNEAPNCGYLISNCVPQIPGQMNTMNIWQPTQCQPLYANAPPKPRRLNDTSSPERSPDRHSEEGRISRMAQPQVYYQNRPPVVVPCNQMPLNNTERRTPDTYGRSKTSVPPTGKIISSKPKLSDYEDVYKQQETLYQKVRYRHPQNPQPPNIVVEAKRFPPRPHSADFLEYDAKRQFEATTVQQPVNHYSGTIQPQRPKSSLDMVYSNDSIHWSEEGYARKMRQSSLYVSPQLQTISNSSRATTPSARHPQMIPVGNYCTSNELASSIMKNHSEAIRQQERRWSEYLDSRDNQFVRSASARLPRPQKEEKIDDGASDRSSITVFKRRNSTDSRDSTTKIQQREESMKRLLEWKQRMLQSPLTRKSSGSSNRGTAQNELSKYYKQQVLRELADQDNRSTHCHKENDISPVPPHHYNEPNWRNGGEIRKWDDECVSQNYFDGKAPRRRHEESGKIRSRSQDGRNSVSRYNSYSSDDEEIEESRDREARKRFRKSSQSGRNRYSSEGTSAPDYENIDTTVHSKTNRERIDYNINFNKSETTEYLNNSSKMNTNSIDKSIKKKPIDSGTLPQSCDSNRVVNIQYDDRLTLSSKHSDSGYDTLQHGHLSQDSQVSDLLKFQFDGNQMSNRISTFPLHTKSTPDEKWGLKLDESRVIKEFSYHYIKSDKEGNTGGSKHSYGQPPNIVQNRIKAFEISKDSDGETKDKFKAQDLLKLSPSLFQSVEENLPFKDCVPASPVPSDQSKQSSRSTKKSILGEKAYMLDKNDKNESGKSVRDLLADFEKKSQLAKEKLAVEEESNGESPGKRYVFSDTETLLYDTSSDADLETNESLLSNLKKANVILSDEEDRDEEVAAVLGKQDNFISSCRDLGRKRDSDRRKRKTSKSSLTDAAYLRLSMAESMVTHDDADSNCSTPLTVSHKKEDSISNEITISLDNHEEHYMPMTPRKKSVLSPTSDIVSHSRSNSTTHTLTLEDFMGTEEENPYVEMTEKGVNMSLLAPDSTDSLFVSKIDPSVINSHINNPESPRYCEIGNADTHYEFIFKSGTNQEPVYMEVNSIIDENKEDGDKHLNDNEIMKCKDNLQSRDDSEEADLQQMVGRNSLPDILNSSAPPLNTGSIKSDSSDADDEASKDLDSLDAPRHPRFSLSDTFRPASYYLGASIGERALIGLTSEHQDSSDSDLVSPPPIPTSPPPLDDLETSLDSTLSIKKGSPLPLKGDNCINENSEQLWNPTPLSGKDLKSVQTRLNALRSPSRHLEEISSETDSVDSSKREQLLKRRPVSADILDSLSESNFIISSPSSGRKSGGSDLDSIGSRNGLAVYLEDGESIDFDQYLEDLQVPDQTSGNVPKDITYEDFGVCLKDKYDVRDQNCIDRIQKSYSELNQQIDDRSTPMMSVSSADKKSGDMRYSEVHYENLQCMFPPSPPSEILEETTSIEMNMDSRLSPKETGSDMSQISGRINLSCKEDKQSGAPYYYSDIIKVDGNSSQTDRSFALSNSRSPRLQTLNNQRENMIDGLGKRNDIGRKVNQIHQYSYQEEGVDEASRLAAELRTASAHLMAIGDKMEFDEKNIYVSDTLQRQKVKSLAGNSIYRSQTPDFRGDSRNIYPFGIRDKSAGSCSSASARGTSDVQLQRRSRSLEGLLDENEDYRTELRQHRGSPGNKIFRLLQTTQQPSPREPSLSVQGIPSSSSNIRIPPPPPDVWEEDALWRENLRRVSIRHTRSLDDLDRDSGPSNIESSPLKDQSNEATYVNGSINSNTRLNQQQYEEDYREGRKVSKKSTDDLDDGVHYERLVRDTESLERMRRGQSYLDGYVWDEEHETFRRGEKVPSNARKLVQPFLEAGLYPTRPPSFEIDREKLRQWDLMSSAPAGMLSAGRVTIKQPTDQQLPTPTPPNSPGAPSGGVLLASDFTHRCPSLMVQQPIVAASSRLLYVVGLSAIPPAPRSVDMGR
ncbi:hypothetical protein AAG570_008253 [Ranatra chinensis]|uniref:PH domain-containing protein n=1 Tax=Ranatra chinensis TaxID=642074 RepID=A0ABD0XSM4_9HEMI